MVAIIKATPSIRRTFMYNENKLDSFFIDNNGEKQPCAKLLMAQNYPMDLERMTQKHRLNMLLKTAEKNPDCTLNSVHISLNFAPEDFPIPDKNLSKAKQDAIENGYNEMLCKIAGEYMQMIGFGDQPFLCYRHFDAGHPHIHIVTIKVRPDGTRISTDRIGKKLSEPARKALEIKYDLTPAEKHKREVFILKPAAVQKAIYGRSETKRAITNVLAHVLDSYKYSSLAGLNAVLNAYNIHADRGGENSRIYKNSGLVYRILDEQGQPVGVSVKASCIYSKPTLKYLEDRFKLNAKASPADKIRIKNAVDLFFKNNPSPDLDALKNALSKQGMRLVTRTNKAGQIYGMTYVDHRNKCVFNGSELGTAYSNNAILIRCGLGSHLCAKNSPSEKIKPIRKDTRQHTPVNHQDKNHPLKAPDPLNDIAAGADDPAGKSILDILLSPEEVYEYLPPELKRTRKKRRRRKPDNN